MKTLSDLIKMLNPALDAGCNFEISKDGKGVVCIDLNTMAKSGCDLRIEDGKIIAYRRYNRIDEVETFGDILSIVHDCAHGRDYFNESWIDVFKDNGMSDPRGIH